MALVELDPALLDGPLPEPVRRLLDDAAARIATFVDAHLDDPIPGFVPSEFARVWQGLATVVGRGLLAGTSFCEWGSGFGVVAMMAAHLGLGACGVEIRPSLVVEAEALARDHELPVEFVCGSYLPPGSEPLADVSTSEFAWIETDGPSGYDELGLDIDDFDLVYAFPWPGEEALVHALFDRHAARGALLLTYNGVEDLRFQRKA